MSTGGQTWTPVIRLAMNGGKPTFGASFTVAGQVLNQFSLDEYEGHLRVATTTGQTWDGTSSNNLYVYDLAGNLTGSLLGMAPGERIYSVRYDGARAYLVTYKQVDPLFAVDLTDPAHPAMLGELKLPGVSDYLHPVNHTHLLGLGRAQAASGPGRLSGLQMSLFDLTDATRPALAAQVNFGSTSSYSAALSDHKAFMFEGTTGAIVVPFSDYTAADGARARTHTHTHTHKHAR
eukprot:CAMPEP_0113689608 /NCGR_PEP_ID=MMETSP0038_2-20120614/17280_1 /TAXON_ID=2898 /ORGANISM="Cryptomonas paramecium" /LENGTH=233 /DNA_ID=CAMNT_0000610741 /DNA_START=383 /DNA_END=1080 /DNA_ORIENTATION=+ /assembly_acc=CAM_ASM_000170